MKKILVTTICLAFATFSFSQQLSRYVVSSGGNYFTNGGYSNSLTIGESMVTTLTSASNVLTQGFQQSSCVYGCIDTTACNYDASATCDDGSCIYMGATPTQVNCWDVFTFNTTTCSWDVSGTQVLAEISQSGETLSAMTNPPGLNADWYNIQNEDGNTRIWLMQEDTSTFNPTFDCSYFIVVNHEGCTDTSEVYYYGASAARIGSFITSPNPTNGLVEVKFENNNNQFVTLKLIGNKGVILDELITTEDNLKLDLSKYPSGNYYLHFNSEGAVQGCGLEKVQKISTKIILNK